MWIQQTHQPTASKGCRAHKGTLLRFKGFSLLADLKLLKFSQLTWL